jgi:hypothetical protein
MEGCHMTTQVNTLVCFTILAGALAIGAPAGAQSAATQSSGTTSSQPGVAQQGGAAPGSAAGGNTTLGSTMQKPGTQSVPVTPQAIQMGESQIRSTLAAHGYTDIKGLEKDGSVFKVSEANRYGETVTDLRIDASNGKVTNGDALSDSQVKEMLRQRQYTDIGDITREGDTIRTTAKLGDRSYDLRIDASAGTMTQQVSGG